MKIKHKLFLALLFLFGVIILLGGMGSYYLRLLAADSAAIMEDNYRTLTYMKNIDDATDRITFDILNDRGNGNDIRQEFGAINTNLALQLTNLTEPGENELSHKLQNKVKRLEATYLDNEPVSDAFFISEMLPLVRDIREQTNNIALINEQTMLRKNEMAQERAKKVVLYMTIFGSVSILTGIIFIIGLPIYISRPFATFNDAIKSVARGNYQVTIPFSSSDEFGQLAASFNKMAAKLNEYEHSSLAKLLKEQKRLNAVIDQMNEAILGLDEDKHIIFANRNCLKLLDMERNNLLGKYAPDVAAINQLMNQLILGVMSGIPASGEPSLKPIKVIEGNKEKLFSRNIVDVVENPTGEEHRRVLIGHLIILTDITYFAEKDKAKTHFMSTLSHELKTPVSAIQMGINLLKNIKTGTLNPEQSEFVDIINDNSSRISHIINEILNLSKIESGSIDINLTKEDAADLIERALEGVRLFISEKQLKINKEIPLIDSFIKVDAHKTVWILNNFLTNAIRYSPQQGVLTISAEKIGDRLRISVVDEGMGIAYENQKRIFQKFTRLVKSETSGTGLGLAISKEFIEAMGGSIGVKSREGSGATFWIECPLDENSAV